MARPIVYGPAFSTYVWSTRLALAEKGVAHELVEIGLDAYREQAHLARHPFAKVPAFEHDGFALYETQAILRYIDEGFPVAPLQPTDLHQFARMSQIMGIVDAYVFPSIADGILYNRILAPQLGLPVDEGAVAAALPRARLCLAEIARLTGLPFVTAPNKFAVQGSHDALVQLSGTLRTLAVSLYKIANDIRLLSCGPRAGIAELLIPENEPGSSIMPGKINPTQVEALTMIAVQVMANDVAVGFGGAGGNLEMNVYKPLMIANIAQSITILTGGCDNFRKFLVEGAQPNRRKIAEYVERSLMLVTALVPVIGYDKAAAIAHHAMAHDQTLKEAALELGFVDEATFDRVVDPEKMVKPYVAAKTG